MECKEKLKILLLEHLDFIQIKSCIYFPIYGISLSLALYNINVEYYNSNKMGMKLGGKKNQWFQYLF